MANLGSVARHRVLDGSRQDVPEMINGRKGDNEKAVANQGAKDRVGESDILRVTFVSEMKWR
jgi:hypothetical protein